MNCYFKNTLRRSKASRLQKTVAYIMGVLRPSELEHRWRRHSTEMQNALNDEHLKRLGWYVANHELYQDWFLMKKWPDGFVYPYSKM